MKHQTEGDLSVEGSRPQDVTAKHDAGSRTLSDQAVVSARATGYTGVGTRSVHGRHEREPTSVEVVGPSSRVRHSILSGPAECY